LVITARVGRWRILALSPSASNTENATGGTQWGMASSWYIKVGMLPHPTVDLLRQTSGHTVKDDEQNYI
jgi:hypothetical protein